MFKALDIETGKDVIILDVLQEEQRQRLRERAHAGKIKCPVCRQDVVVKAGEILRHHFAHRHLSDCPSATEPIELLKARSALYTWLHGKLGDCVTIEKQLDGVALPHAVDCWAERDKDAPVAYWIVERNRRTDYREQLRSAMTRGGEHWNTIFLSDMIQRKTNKAGVLNLSVTEREFMATSDYDVIYPRRSRHEEGKTLHYLEVDKAELITARNMVCTEAPQQYSGTEISTGLAEVRFAPRTGEFVHPGEWERLTEHRRREAEREARRRAEAARREEERRRQEEERIRQAAEREARRRKEEARRDEERRRENEERLREQAEFQQRLAEEETRRKREGLERRRNIEPHISHAQPETSEPPLPLYKEKEGTCVFCGEKTRDWWSFDGKTGMCKCRKCQKKGITSANGTSGGLGNEKQ